MLWALETFGNWLRAIPGPTEHWATIIAALAWPVAALIIVYILRKPLASAAGKLADRFEKDDIEIPGFLKVTGNVPLSTLKQGAVTEQPGTPEEADAKLVESLLEYAGESSANALKFLAWIESNVGPSQDPEAFLSETGFAEQRKKAYQELTKGDRE